MYPPTHLGAESTKRYLDDPGNREMMECKAYMCELCLAVDNLAIDHILTRLIPIFKNYEDHMSGGRRGYTGAHVASQTASDGSQVPDDLAETVLQAIKTKIFDFDVMMRGNFGV